MEERDVASVEECAQALTDLSERIASVDPEVRSKHSIDRSISVDVEDLATVFTGQIDRKGLHDITTEPSHKAQIRLTCKSDDLLAVTSGALKFTSALASGRLKIDASLPDMLRLRSML